MATEGVTPTVPQKIEVRSFCKTVGLTCNPGEEPLLGMRALLAIRDVARGAGGEPPLPAPPARPVLEELLDKDGNELVIGLAENKGPLLEGFGLDTVTREKAVETILMQQVQQGPAIT